MRSRFVHRVLVYRTPFLSAFLGEVLTTILTRSVTTDRIDLMMITGLATLLMLWKSYRARKIPR